MRTHAHNPHGHKASYLEAPYSGVRWYHERHLLDGFQAAGFTKNGLRRLFKALGVPQIHLPSGVHYDGHSVAIAMRAIGRIGQPDFAAPGSEPIRRASEAEARTLDPLYVRENLEGLLAEMWASRPKDYRDKATLKKESSRVADAIVQFSVLRRISEDEQTEHIRRSVRRAQKEGLPQQGHDS